MKEHGERVRLTEKALAALRGDCTNGHVGPFSRPADDVPFEEEDCYGCSSGHADEFQGCIGLTEGLVNWNKPGESDPTKFGPELEVRWIESKLRYAYAPEQLEIVE